MHMMIRTAMVTMFVLASLMISLPIKSSNLVSAQSPGENTTSAVSPESAALIKKILSASSFSNIQTISFVKGIEVSGVNLGDSDISITLKRSTSENNASNISTPVTVTAVKFPGSSIKDVLTLVEASAKLRGENTPGPLAGMMEKMGGLIGSRNGSNASDSMRPLQALMQLGLNTQVGVGNIVGGDWKTPRTVTTGLLDLGELLGMGSNPSPNAKAHFIMIFVVPYVGKTTLGSVPLK
jgi:hypothetical protein